MGDLTDFTVQVLKGRDLVVTKPKTGEQAVYRREGNSPLLVLADSMRIDPDPARARFLVSAWKAAHARAQQLGWLRS